MKLILSALFAVLLLSSCASLTPQTVKEVFEAKQGLDTVAQMVVDCVQGTPTEAKIADDFNYLIDLKEDTKEMRPDAEALKAIAGGRKTIDKAGLAWVSVKRQIINDGLECDERLPGESEKIETVYDKTIDALDSNERIVTAFEWGELLAGMVAGPSGSAVVRLTKAAATQG